MKTVRNRIKRRTYKKRRTNRKRGGSHIRISRPTIQPMSERQQVTERIQQYITDFAALPDTPERLNIITEMFNYIYDNAHIILTGYPRFRAVVRDKIWEVRDKMQRNQSISTNIVGLEEATNKIERMLNDIEYNELHR